MTISSRSKAKSLFAAGLFLFPIALLLMRAQLDVAAGIAVGVGIAMTGIGLKKMTRI